MRTVAEIREYIFQKLDAAEKEKAAARLREQEILTAIDAAKTAQREAAEADNAEAYKNASEAIAFNMAKLEAAQRVSIAPAFTHEELKSLSEEMTNSRRIELAPIYRAMVKNRAEAHSLFEQYKRIGSECQRTWNRVYTLNGGAGFLYFMASADVEGLFKENETDQRFNDFIVAPFMRALPEP